MDGNHPFAWADPISQWHDGEVLANARGQWRLAGGILGVRRKEASGSRHLTHGQTDVVIIIMFHRSTCIPARGGGGWRIIMRWRIGEAHNGGGSGRSILHQISRRIHVPRIAPAHVAFFLALLFGITLDGAGVVRDDAMATGGKVVRVDLGWGRRGSRRRRRSRVIRGMSRRMSIISLVGMIFLELFHDAVLFHDLFLGQLKFMGRPVDFILLFPAQIERRRRRHLHRTIRIGRGSSMTPRRRTGTGMSVRPMTPTPISRLIRTMIRRHLYFPLSLCVCLCFGLTTMEGIMPRHSVAVEVFDY
jgi:hypothetical protein